MMSAVALSSSGVIRAAAPVKATARALGLVGAPAMPAGLPGASMRLKQQHFGKRPAMTGVRRRGVLVVRADGIDEAAKLAMAGPSDKTGPAASAVVPKLPRSDCARVVAAEEGFNLATTSFGTIGLSVGRAVWTGASRAVPSSRAPREGGRRRIVSFVVRGACPVRAASRAPFVEAEATSTTRGLSSTSAMEMLPPGR